MDILGVNPALERAIALGANCESCPLQAKAGPVYAKIAKTSPIYPFDITFVTKSPERLDVVKGEPLSTNYLLTLLMKDLHIQPSEATFTGSTLCTTFQVMQKSDWKHASNCCRPRLANEIGEPKRTNLVIMLGKEALQSITGKDSIKDWRGFPLAPLELFDSENTIYFPTYHPQNIRQDPAFSNIWKLDVKRALGFASGQLKPIAWPNTFVDDDENSLLALEGLLKTIEREPTDCGVDVETAGKEPLLVKLLCIGISTKSLAVCIPFQSRYSDALGLWRRILGHKNCKIVCHNGQHDILSLESHGIECSPLAFDTLGAARIIYPRLDHDLGSVMTYHHFIPRHKSQYKGGREEAGQNAWEKASHDPVKFKNMRIYCARDSYGTLICKDPQIKLMEAMER